MTEQFNGQHKIPVTFNISQACLKHSNTSQQALIIDAENKLTRTLSYAELASESFRCANALLALGVKKGDTIAICLPNCVEFPIAFFGILSIGAIAVPLSFQLKTTEISYIQKDSDAKYLITHNSKLNSIFDDITLSQSLKEIWAVDASMITETHEQVKSFSDTLESCEPIAPTFKTLANDPAYLVYTSGTTGYPKGVLHAHRALLGRLPASIDWFDYRQDERILHSGKFNWTYVLGTGLMDPLFLGKTVIVFEGNNNPNKWIELIDKHDCTTFIGVPTIFRQILQKTTAHQKNVPTLRHCMSAGEHLPDNLLTLWQTRFEQPIYEAVGMSECSYYLSQRPHTNIKPGSAGMPQRGHDVCLFDEAMDPIPDNTEGMICIHKDDPGLFLRYWNLPDLTENCFKGNYFLTGDYAKRDTDGYFWFLGRKDDIINSFGYRISPHEIERVMKTHPAVEECIALEETVAQNKSIVSLAVKRCIKKPEISDTELIQFATEKLADYKVPRKIYFIEAFPRTTNGKVMRKKLKKNFASSSLY